MFKKPNLKWTVITVSIIICLGIIGLTNSKINSANPPVLSQIKQQQTSTASLQKTAINVVRARGKSAYGEISIVSKGEEKIEQLGADSSYGKATDYSFTGDYDVVYKADDGKETVITTLNDLTIIQPQNSIIELSKLIVGDTDIFYFIPEYSGSNDVEIRFFAITKQKEAFQYGIEDNNAREFGDINSLSESTGVLSTDSKTYSPPKTIGKDNIELISVYNIGGGQNPKEYKVIFNVDVKKRVFKYVSKEEI